jgi:hypothetical protein
MISHKHKCIYIHISKCAGTTIENSFGLLGKPINKPDYDHLYGWCPINSLFLHHATPEQLLNKGLISREVWDKYFKFIIVRNPWDRAYSDYVWMIKHLKAYDNFFNFINAKGVFKETLTVRNKYYRGDHLNKQKDYFFINGEEINYDQVLKFENLKGELSLLKEKLNLDVDFFEASKNISNKKYEKYDHFFNTERRCLVQNTYSEDIEYLNYSYGSFNNSLLKTPFIFKHFSLKKALKIYFNSFKK